MAVIKAVSSRASIGRAVKYVTKDEKTEEKLISGKDCNPNTAIEEMKATKEMWGKTDGRQYKHYVQSFNPEDNVSPELAHSIGKKLLEDEKFKGHEVVIATHIDKGHIHNHFIVNSVNFENGKKFNEKKQELEHLKQRSNDLSREHGLSVPDRGDEITSFSKEKYKALEKGITSEYKSYVLDCYKAVSEVKDKATGREDFIARMKDQGYETTWSENRKHITFEDRDGNKVRNSNLEKTFKESFGKEDLERGFESNHERASTLDRAREQLRGIGDGKAADGAGREDTDAIISKFRSASEDADLAVRADEGDRTDRLAKEQSHERERNRGREQKAADRGSKGFEHER